MINYLSGAGLENQKYTSGSFVAWIKNKIPSVGSIFFPAHWRNFTCSLFPVLTPSGGAQQWLRWERSEVMVNV